MEKLLLDSLEDLVVFAAVAREGSFSAASRRLGIAGSAVSKRVAQLEARIGCQLVQRSTRSLSLTEVGALVFERVNGATELLSEAISLATERTVAPRGVLRVSASVSFGQHRIVPLLPEFRARFPDVQVDLILLDRMVNLVEEGIDLAVRISADLPESSIARPLCQVRYHLCASPVFMRKHPVEQPADLEQLPCIQYGSGVHKIQWRLSRLDERVTLNVTTPLMVNNSDAVALLARQGQGVALLADYACESHLRDGSLTCILPDWAVEGPFGNLAHIVWRPQSSMPKKSRVLIDYLCAAMADDASAMRRDSAD